MAAEFVNTVSFTLVGDGSTAAFDIDIRNIPDAKWDSGAPKVAADAIYGSVAVTNGSYPVTVTAASLQSGQILHIDLNTSVHNAALYVVSASLKFPLA